MRIVSGHQPAYLPWLGYFHKLSLADVFVFMDTVQYLESDWNNRNRIRTSQGWTWLTVPIDRKRSTGPALDQIVINQDGAPDGKRFWQNQHWRALQTSYGKTPFYKLYEAALRDMYLGQRWSRLIDLCWAQFRLFSEWLELDHIPVVRMSERLFNGHKDDLVLDHCIQLQGDAVVFGALGRDYVNLDKFRRSGVRVYFQDYHHPRYLQRFAGFESHMCVLDLLCNHGPESLARLQGDNVDRNTLENGDEWL